MTTNHRLPNYINGRWQNSSAKEFADVINPATGETLAQAPLDGEGDVMAAIESAAAAFPAWRRTPPEERIQFLFKLKQLLEDHRGVSHADYDGERQNPHRIARRVATGD